MLLLTTYGLTRAPKHGYTTFMPKGRKGKSKPKSKKIPKWGRSEKDVRKDMGLRSYSSDVPIGNTGPTVVQGKMYGGMPNRSRKAMGGLRTQRGRRG